MSFQIDSITDLTWLIIYALAAVRVTHLLVHDTITEPIRAWFVRQGEWVDDLVTCPWCMSFWVSLLAAATYLAYRHLILDLFALAFAFSYIVGRLETHTHDPDTD